VKYDFQIGMEDLRMENGNVVSGKKAIVRQDTHRCLGIVSNRYKPTLHADVINLFDGIKSINRERVITAKGGAIMFADYGFTSKVKHNSAEVKKGDLVDFKLRAFNSYDKSMELGFEIRAMRLVCTNGLVIPKAVSRIGQRHIGDYDIKQVSENIFGKLEDLSSVVDRWRIWNTIRNTKETTFGFLQHASVRDRMKKEILDDCLRAKNIWDLYNVFTHFTSHKLRFKKDSDIEFRRHLREQQLLKKFYTYKWQ